jgi:hypothetical protein
VLVSVALNWNELPCWIRSLPGLKVTVGTAAVIVSIVELLIAPAVAVMVVVPTLSPVASPWVSEVLLIVATAEFDELQVTIAVMFCPIPLVAVNC